jgi:hypothetical protein
MRKLPLPRFIFNPLIGQVAAVAVGGLAVVIITLFISNIVERSSETAANDSNAALLASEIRAEMDKVSLLRLDSALAPT